MLCPVTFVLKAPEPPPVRLTAAEKEAFFCLSKQKSMQFADDPLSLQLYNNHKANDHEPLIPDDVIIIQLLFKQRLLL